MNGLKLEAVIKLTDKHKAVSATKTTRMVVLVDCKYKPSYTYISAFFPLLNPLKKENSTAKTKTSLNIGIVSKWT